MQMTANESHAEGKVWGEESRASMLFLDCYPVSTPMCSPTQKLCLSPVLLGFYGGFPNWHY